MKQWIIAGIIILVLIASYLWNRNSSDVEEALPAEEVLVQEDGTVVKKIGDTIEVMSEEEVAQRNQAADEKLAEVAPVELSPVGDKAGSGESTSIYSDGTYYQKVVLEGLSPVQKGYYYEAWLKDAAGNLNSIGRVAVSGGEGILYYSASEDKSGYAEVIVSYEVEDGNPAIGDIVLESQQ